jgi:ubiquitin-conjugating enzyme E2 R
MAALQKLLQNQYKTLQREPVEGFCVEPDESNFLQWKIWMEGPKGSPYEGGVFQLLMTFPETYPMSPPELRFISEFWHPNVYKDGRVCISILHPPGEDVLSGELPEERWLPTQTVSTIMLSVISMLSDPNFSSPANVDASVQWRTQRAKFQEHCRMLVEKANRQKPPHVKIPHPETNPEERKAAIEKRKLLEGTIDTVFDDDDDDDMLDHEDDDVDALDFNFDPELSDQIALDKDSDSELNESVSRSSEKRKQKTQSKNKETKIKRLDNTKEEKTTNIRKDRKTKEKSPSHSPTASSSKKESSTTATTTTASAAASSLHKEKDKKKTHKSKDKNSSKKSDTKKRNAPSSEKVTPKKREHKEEKKPNESKSENVPSAAAHSSSLSPSLTAERTSDSSKSHVGNNKAKKSSSSKQSSRPRKDKDKKNASKSVTTASTENK